MRTLVLNASFEPHDIVAARNVIGLLLDEKAVLIEAGTGVFRSQHLTLQAPSVIRLRRYVKTPYRRVPLTTPNVLARDGGKCGYCGGKADTMDHIIPRSRGGAHSWMNVVAACADPCNSQKDNHLLSEIGWELLTTPWQPQGMAGRLALGHAIDPLWGPYLGSKTA